MTSKSLTLDTATANENFATAKDTMQPEAEKEAAKRAAKALIALAEDNLTRAVTGDGG